MTQFTMLDRSRRARSLLTSSFLAVFLLLTVWATISAQEIDPRPPDLSESTKTVDKEVVNPGGELEYTVVINNDGTLPEPSAYMTDSLPAGLTYVSDTLHVDGGGLYGVSGNVITWTGTINNNAAVQIRFRAQVSDAFEDGDVITNTAEISGSEEFTAAVSAAASVSTQATTTLYLPSVSRAYPLPGTPVLQEIGRPNAENEWTLSWTIDDATFIEEYEVQESTSPSFDDAETVARVEETSVEIAKDADFDNIYYYRVRAIGPGGISDWSNSHQVIANYRDDFDSSSSGWTIRRQDTDDVENYAYYRDGHFVLEIDGRWDYGIASPLRPAPDGAYAIEARVRMDEPGNTPDNLHSYGLIFGADWDGTECPNNDYSSCFNHYYRLNVIWTGGHDTMKLELKRIDFHDSVTNAGGGESFYWVDPVTVNAPSETYQVWRIEVDPASGRITLFVNGNFVREVYDTEYISNRYFGVFASSDEYLGAEPWFDWYTVSVIE
ncbi:MAG TPA: DUF11 domain-containing protein [Candidatus Sulfomarinibacteraceae bacterium]|nr:DUF11 domain-containing protein [Candidatus Sulfomarinibacteraceae bacterium]